MVTRSRQDSSTTRSMVSNTQQSLVSYTDVWTVPKNIRVMPRTYQEFMYYLEARRRAEQVRRTLDEGVSVSPKQAAESLTE